MLRMVLASSASSSSRRALPRLLTRTIATTATASRGRVGHSRIPLEKMAWRSLSSSSSSGDGGGGGGDDDDNNNNNNNNDDTEEKEQVDKVYSTLFGDSDILEDYEADLSVSAARKPRSDIRPRFRDYDDDNYLEDDDDNDLDRMFGGNSPFQQPSQYQQSQQQQQQQQKRKSRATADSDNDDDDDTALDASKIPVPLWSDNMEISEERWTTKMDFDDIPDWSPDFVSRISQERVQVYEDGIPTLAALAQLPLPPPPPPHPGHGQTKEYADYRRHALYERIRQQAVQVASPHVSAILALPTWEAKQDAVDDLFETVEGQLRHAEPILQGHPKFGAWVETALESYLKQVAKPPPLPVGDADAEASSLESAAATTTNDTTTTTDIATTEETLEMPIYPTREQDEQAVPIFMDCYNPSDFPTSTSSSSGDADDKSSTMVPKILSPLKPHPRDGPGRMVEEWELSAHSTTKRIMLRQSTRQMAQALTQSPTLRVLVTGKRGVGKTAAVASIAAAARKSGYIVLYMPDGNRLHRLGYYVEPNPKLPGMFDLPVLSQEVCRELLAVHEADLEGMVASKDVMEEYFTETQLAEDLSAEYSGDSMSLVDLLKAAETHLSCAAMCYSAVVHCLVNQDEKPFLMALDEFNCYFEPGHYFHMEYDEDVNQAIPYDKINLFKPALDAMALSMEDDEDIPFLTPVAPKRGGIVVGISESCAIGRKVTDSLTAHANRAASDKTQAVPLVVCEVPRFTELEVDHILANFESIGIGNLRCDKGETVMNKEGIAYIRMVSSSVGQNLLDVCCS